MFVITTKTGKYSFGKPLGSPIAVASSKEAIEEFCKADFLNFWRGVDSSIIEETIEFSYERSEQNNVTFLIIKADNDNPRVIKTTSEYQIYKVPYARKETEEDYNDTIERFFYG